MADEKHVPRWLIPAGAVLLVWALIGSAADNGNRTAALLVGVLGVALLACGVLLRSRS